MGQILEALDRLKLTRKTLVIVTSNNGALDSQGADFGHRPNGDLRGQNVGIYKAGHRMPFLVRWPGMTPADTACDETISLVDMMTTLCAAAEIEMPADAGPDSYNLLPAMLGGEYARPIRGATVSVSKFLLYYEFREGP